MKKKLSIVCLITMFTLLLSVGVMTVSTEAATLKKVKKVTVEEDGRTALSIKWKKVKGAKKYQIKYSTNAKVKKAKTKTAYKNSFRVPGLKSATTYYLRVRAVASDGTYGKWSKIVSATTDDNKLDSTNGYFNLKIVGNGKTTTTKVNVKFDETNTDDENNEGVEATLSTSGTNGHKVSLSSGSVITTKDTEGNFNYNVLKVDFKYEQPAHYGATISTSGNISNNWAVDGPGYFTTINGVGTYVLGCYHSLSNNVVESSVTLNASDIGAIKVDGKTYHATITINLTQNYGGVAINPNGGSWIYEGKTYTSFTGVNWVGVCGTTMTIPNPTREGYVFKGWTTTENSALSCSYGTLTGNIYTGMSASVNISSSSVFTFCGEATSLDNAKNANYKCYTTLTAQWQKK